ncbi:hypothetical protein DAPPUDRAFT_118883 [Daphnia pulex]|uniref:Uncharacterized protein n=1 Tax=Daphnia pulex TaxID=6669 RepID=E9HWY1_DAPPU|nr:hypothetical protein DAPPUDRAFT_118883 [Daphnia pulex]|eukprot:EFX63750.1 hypothetical protein DAPPUDRAFT_118883 [Daphnia pulex]
MLQCDAGDTEKRMIALEHTLECIRVRGIPDVGFGDSLVEKYSFTSIKFSMDTAITTCQKTGLMFPSDPFGPAPRIDPRRAKWFNEIKMDESQPIRRGRWPLDDLESTEFVLIQDFCNEDGVAEPASDEPSSANLPPTESRGCIPHKQSYHWRSQGAKGENKGNCKGELSPKLSLITSILLCNAMEKVYPETSSLVSTLPSVGVRASFTAF